MRSAALFVAFAKVSSAAAAVAIAADPAEDLSAAAAAMKLMADAQGILSMTFDRVLHEDDEEVTAAAAAAAGPESKPTSKPTPVTWDEVQFWMGQGQRMYASWTSTDAGLFDFDQAVALLESSDDPSMQQDALAKAYAWKGKAHYKLKQHTEAIASYQAALTILESKAGPHDSEAMERTYPLLAAAFWDAGSPHSARRAALVAIRMEHYHWGPLGGPLQTRALLQYYFPADWNWEKTQESWALEVQGDRLVELEDYQGAFQVYSQAALVESQCMGMTANRMLARLYRKAVLMALPTTFAPFWTPFDLGVVGVLECPIEAHPNFCSKLYEGNQDYLAGDNTKATLAFAQALTIFKTDKMPHHSMEPWQWSVLVLCSIVIVLWPIAMVSMRMVKVWSADSMVWWKSTSNSQIGTNPIKAVHVCYDVLQTNLFNLIGWITAMATVFQAKKHANQTNETDDELDYQTAVARDPRTPTPKSEAVKMVANIALSTNIPGAADQPTVEVTPSYVPARTKVNRFNWATARLWPSQGSTTNTAGIVRDIPIKSLTGRPLATSSNEETPREAGACIMQPSLFKNDQDALPRPMTVQDCQLFRATGQRTLKHGDKRQILSAGQYILEPGTDDDCGGLVSPSGPASVKVQEDIAASLGSLGKLLAGFETDLIDLQDEYDDGPDGPSHLTPLE